MRMSSVRTDNCGGTHLTSVQQHFTHKVMHPSPVQTGISSAPSRSSTSPHCQSSHLVASGTGVYRYYPVAVESSALVMVVSLYTTPPLAEIVKSGQATVTENNVSSCRGYKRLLHIIKYSKDCMNSLKVCRNSRDR